MPATTMSSPSTSAPCMDTPNPDHADVSTSLEQLNIKPAAGMMYGAEKSKSSLGPSYGMVLVVEQMRT